jgi:hypothetical protein
MGPELKKGAPKDARAWPALITGREAPKVS